MGRSSYHIKWRNRATDPALKGFSEHSTTRSLTALRHGCPLRIPSSLRHYGGHVRCHGCWFGLAQILHKRLQAAAETVGRLGQAMLVTCDGSRGYLLMRIVMERDYRITG